MGGNATVRTHVAQSYPPKLAENYAVLVNQALEMRGDALERGQPVPLAVQEVGDGLCSSLCHAARLLPDRSVPVECVVEQKVPYGLGALRGFVPSENAQWAEEVEHPSANTPQGAPKHIILALRYEIDSDIEDVDNFRRRKLYK